MIVDNNIFAVVEPAILPTKIEIDSKGEEKGGDRRTKTMATLEPFIRINGLVFNPEQITSVKLNMEGSIPQLQARIVDNRRLFDTAELYPRDGDVVTLLINSKNSDTFKSIHMDFNIINVQSSDLGGEEYKSVSFRGVAKIPNLTAEACRYYEDGPSVDHVEAIARDLKLGMATNITSTEDTQSRIQAWQTYESFIADVVSDSYVAEDAFTTWYIDQYYYLNFIDVNRIFDSENPPLHELQKTLMTLQASLAEQAQNPENLDNMEVPLILTNSPGLKTTNMFIHEYKLINNSSSVSLSSGYDKHISYYDNNAPKGSRVVEYTISPFVSKSLPESDEPLRGARTEGEDDRVKQMVKHKWLGRVNAGEDGLGNTHPNFLHSQMVDAQNSSELDKMYIKVKLGTFNPSLYKYQKIPIIITDVNTQSAKIRSELNKASSKLGNVNESLFPAKDESPEENPDANNVPNGAMNTMLSGYYVIGNINYTYDGDSRKMIQELTLLRREWPAASVPLAAQMEAKKEEAGQTTENAGADNTATNP